jgi:hypothetical protein
MSIGATPYGDGVIVWVTSKLVLVRVMGVLRRLVPEEVAPWK